MKKLVFIFIGVLISLDFFSQTSATTNLDFEMGNLSGWTITGGLNQNSTLMAGCCNLNNGRAFSISGGVDIITNKSLISPLGGSWVAKLNEDTSRYRKVTRLSNTFSVTSTENLLNVAYMSVLEKCGQDCSGNPFSDIKVFDSNNAIVYQYFVQSTETFCQGSNSEDMISYGILKPYFSNPWRVLKVDFSGAIGSIFRIEITTSSCSGGGHAGYGYFDIALTQSHTTPNIITFNGLPTLITHQNQYIPICETNTFNVNAPVGASSYTWNGPGITGLNTQSVSVAMPDVVYTLSYNKPSNWGNITNVFFSFTNKPFVSLTGPTVSCVNSNVSLVATGAFRYTWFPNNSIFSSFSNPSIQTLPTPDITTTYTVIGDYFGCKDTAYHTINVLPIPSLSVTGNNVCSGSTTTVQVSGANSYTWNSGATTNSIVVTPSFSTMYTVLGEDLSNGCVNSISIPLTLDYPSISINPYYPKTCYGDSSIITAYGATSYSVNGVQTTSRIGLRPLSNTTYTLSGTNLCGTFYLPFTVTVTPKPIVSITAPSTVCYGATATLTAAGASSYTWAPSFSNLSTLIINNITQNQTYHLSGKTNGCFGFDMKTITVGPQITTTITAYPKHNICLGQTATLTAVGASSYTWSTGQTTNSIVVTPTATGFPTYGVFGTNTSLCNESFGFTLDVSNPASAPLIQVFYSNTDTICSGRYVNATICCGAYTYLVENTNAVVSMNFTLSPTSTTIYTISTNSGCTVESRTLQVNVIPSPTVSLIGPDTVCIGSVATYTASGDSLYSWSGGPFNTSNTYSIICTGTHIVTLSGAGHCSNFIVKEIIPISLKPISIIGNVENCSISNATLTAYGANSYTWSNGFIGNPIVLHAPLENLYSVNGVTSNGCISADSIHLNSIVDRSDVYLFPISQNICSDGSAITMDALPKGGTYYINGITGTNTILPLASTLYSVSYIYVNVNGCSDTSSTSISISSIPTLTLSTSGYVCLGSNQHINATGANTYTWSTGASTSSINVIPTASTIYTVTGTDINNCSTTQTVSVTVDNTCADVWPGDANSDGTADNLDVLELGLHYSQAGAPRAITSNSWQSYVATNWAGTISNGKNLNHSDCNGDGMIDTNDTLAIYLNYGLTHAFKSAQQTSTNEQLTIAPDQLMVSKGQWGTASVYLGTSANPINTINGLAFTLHFDQSLIEPNSLQIEYPVSFLNTGQNLSFRKQDYVNGALYAATTHTNNSNINGYGKIAVIHYQIKSSLVHDTVLAFNLVQATQSSANGSLVPLTSGSASMTAIGASVGINELWGNDLLAIYPNPAKSAITITTTSELKKVELVSVTGQVIIYEPASGNQHQLDVSSVSNGVYFISVYSHTNSVQRKKVVIQH